MCVLTLRRRSLRRPCLLLLKRRRCWSPCRSPLCRSSHCNPSLLRRGPELCGVTWRRSPLRACRCPLGYCCNAFTVLGSFPLKCLFPLLPSKWWSVYSHRAFKVLYRAPSSTPADAAGVSSTWWPLRYNVTTSLCGLLVGSSYPGGGTRVPFYLVLGTSLRTNHPRGRHFLHPWVEVASPYPHSVTGFAIWYT